MSLIVCTLFEGSYHYGLAGLTNSLHKYGFRGRIYAGYRGELPFWAKDATETTDLNWKGERTMKITSNLDIYFLPLITDYHLTNYKPDFMLALLSKASNDVEGIFYFDPDIIISAPWEFYKKWVHCGIALCEDVNSPLDRLHPRRVYWRNYFKPHGLRLDYKTPIYVNGGFIGLQMKDTAFLKAWQKVQEAMALEIGGLNRSIFKNSEPLPEHAYGDFAPFGKTDQDALNATVENYEAEYSLLGKDGMSFTRGISVMRHALGSPKPWALSPMKQMFSGRSPRSVDKDFWKHAEYPIAPYKRSALRKMNLLINFAAFIGRFYQRR